MAFIKKITVGLVALLVIFVGVGFLLPSDFKVERSVKIHAPATSVFAMVRDLKEWQKWGVWFKRDPQMKITYSGPEGRVGMKSVWLSEEEGSGEMEVLEIVADKKLVYSLYFPEFEMASTGEFVLLENNGQTTVTWIDYGDMGANPLMGYMVLMMDGFIGPDFEAGLENLKTLVENQSNDYSALVN